jgi:hypothetical protein
MGDHMARGLTKDTREPCAVKVLRRPREINSGCVANLADKRSIAFRLKPTSFNASSVGTMEISKRAPLGAKGAPRAFVPSGGGCKTRWPHSPVFQVRLPAPTPVLHIGCVFAFPHLLAAWRAHLRDWGSPAANALKIKWRGCTQFCYARFEETPKRPSAKSLERLSAKSLKRLSAKLAFTRARPRPPQHTPDAFSKATSPTHGNGWPTLKGEREAREIKLAVASPHVTVIDNPKVEPRQGLTI